MKIEVELGVISTTLNYRFRSRYNQRTLLSRRWSLSEVEGGP